MTEFKITMTSADSFTPGNPRRFTVHEEKGLTGYAGISRDRDGEMKLMVEVECTQTNSTVETYRTFRPATPEDCERIRLRRLQERHAQCDFTESLI